MIPQSFTHWGTLDKLLPRKTSGKVECRMGLHATCFVHFMTCFSFGWKSSKVYIWKYSRKYPNLSTRLFWPIHIRLSGCRVIRISRFFDGVSFLPFIRRFPYWLLAIQHDAYHNIGSSNNAILQTTLSIEGPFNGQPFWIDLPLQDLRYIYGKGWK